MSTDKTETKDLKKQLGNPKITFVLGGPASGKGTQCAKLVEEFGYSHISTGDLFRAEQAKGTKEGERIKKIMADGGLVPCELTVQILIQALIANPSKNILIDGFPRQVEQAIYFEQNVCEAQTVLFFDVSEEVMLQRCLKRAENSQREDDKEETLMKRLKNYNEQSKPVVDLYEQFGKVRRIDASQDIQEVYEQTKKAMLPSISFILGPKTSGKATLGQALADRTNMKFIDFNHFVEQNGLAGQHDDDVTGALIKSMVEEHSTRVLVKNFPQNDYQAKYFIKNCTSPSKVYALKCSKDICQERMIELGQDHPSYVSSSILSKKIQQYHDTAAILLPFLKANTSFHEIDTSGGFDKTFESICELVEPTVIHIRVDSVSSDLRTEIVDNLVQNHGYVNLDANILIKDENERKTEIGLEFLSMTSLGKNITGEMIVRMLKKIIYSGLDERNKFILTSFPDIIDHAREFEKSCAHITAMIYAVAKEPIVEIKNNNLSVFNLDAMFQKNYKLKIINEWNWQNFQEKLGHKVDYGVVHGRSLSGKSEVASQIKKLLGYKVLEMKQIVEDIKKSLGTDDEPYEGDITDDQIQKAILDIIMNDKKSGNKVGYVFDSFSQKDVGTFTAFLNQLGLPDFVIHCSAEQKQIEERYKKKNETEEIGEELAEELKKQDSDAQEIKKALEEAYAGNEGRVNVVDLNCAGSLELTIKSLSDQFVPKVLLINHEKNLGVDTTCANLSIKYSMLYISVYQAIRAEIESQSDLGKKLVQYKRSKELKMKTEVRDEFQEVDYSATHFRPEHVVEVIRKVISTQRTTQKYILLEGMINNSKLSQEEDRLEQRYMDELLLTEKHIGEVLAVIGLQYEYEKEYMEEHEIEWIKFEPKEEPQKAEPQLDENGNPIEPQPTDQQQDDDDEQNKKPKEFDPRDISDKWTQSNKRSKNLPQIYINMKGSQLVNHETRTSEQFSTSKYEAILNSLDQFCKRLVEGEVSNEKLVDENSGKEYSKKYLYQQVVFSE